MSDFDAFGWARDLLVTLVEIPSVSGAEHDVAAHVEQLVAGLGVPVRRQEVPGHGPNLLIGPAEAPLMLTAHLDTVPASWDWDGRAVVEGTLVHGLGALDDKGSVVACLLTLRLLLESGVDPAVLPISIGLTVDEEEDGTGSMALAALVAPPYVIALEGTELEVCTAEAGILHCILEMPGRSHHGSRPELGDNAVHKAVELVRELLSLPVLNRAHPETMDNAAYVQEFSGGSDLYVVPDSARLQVLARLGGVGDAEEAHRALAELCERHGAAFELVEAVDPVITPVGSPVVALLDDAVRRETGREPVHTTMPSWTDAHSFADEGSTTVGFGPGTLRVAHRPDEHIDVHEVVAAARILTDVALRTGSL
jgi:acetylornithine deacetylase/succinyl-diaminopimelate desuccinylase